MNEWVKLGFSFVVLCFLLVSSYLAFGELLGTY